MGNKHRGSVTFEALGRSLTLKFSTNAICELEDALDKPIGVIGDSMNDPSKARIKTLRAVLWAGLQDNHPDVDMKAAGEIIDDLGTDVAGEKIGEAFRLAFPESEQKAENPPKAATRK